MAEEDLRLEPPKGSKSPYWAHFGFEVDKQGKRLDEKSVRCRICNHKVGFSGNTTNLGQHLQKWHPEVLSGEGSGAKASKVQQLTLESCSVRPISKLPSGSKRAKEITQRIAEFIARDMRPVSVIEGTGFVNLVATLDPTYQVPSRKHIMKVLHDMNDVKVHLQAELESVENVALTTDHWTSRAIDSYLGLTAHFITQDWELVAHVLTTKEVRERHTAVNVADDLQAVVDDWNLAPKVAGIITNNARNMVAALAQLPWIRVSCFAHTLQLAVKEGLKVPAVVEILARCRKIVGHFKHSCVASRALEAAQVRLGLHQHHLVQEVSTRWNSSYAMLSRIAEQQTAISAVLAESTRAVHRDMILSSGEVAQVECAMAVLKPLAQATEMLGGEKMPSLSVVQPMLTALKRKHLKVSVVEPNMALDMKQAIASSIDEHFSDDDQRRVMLIASCLDPRFCRLKFLPFNGFLSPYVASQSWCLTRFLPLLIGDLVPEGNEYWENFLQLVRIVDYVFAPVTSEALATYIGTLIEDFLVEFQQLYPDRRLTPKLHYMIHIPSWILRWVMYACRVVTGDTY